MTEQLRRVCEIVHKELGRRSSTKLRLARLAECSDVQVQRALTTMRRHGAPISFHRQTGLWCRGSWEFPVDLMTRDSLLLRVKQLEHEVLDQ